MVVSMNLGKRKKKVDWLVVLFLLLFLGISYLSISSAMTYLSSYLGNLALKQIVFYIIGALLIFLIRKFDNKFLFRFTILLYIGCNLLLLFLLIWGVDVNGSKCWFMIPGLGSFQPSEFMKIILILVISSMTSRFFERKKVSVQEEFWFLCRVLLVVFIPSILTFLEPDTGAVLMYLIITLGILLVSPLRRRWFVAGFSILFLVIGVVFLFYFYKQDLLIDLVGTDLFYRMDRVFAWQNQEGLQLENSLTSIGSSGLLGHGYKGTPLYFPESGTDFIFSVFACNFGLIGSSLLLFLFLIFDIHFIEVAKESKNIEYKYLLSGFLFMLIYQQVQNVGMTLGLFPITGITLPFISYGGSSLLSYFLIIGIIFNIYSDNRKKEPSVIP